jgi:hypothetical protein
MPMTDDELARFLGIAGHSKAPAIIAALKPTERAMYDSMATVETELKLWQDGLGPKPKGVIICGCGKRGRHRHRRK